MNAQHSYVAIDLGATNTRVARYDTNSTVPSYQGSQPTPPTATAQIELLLDLAYSAATPETAAVGIALATAVRPFDGRVLRGGILKLHDFDLADLVQRRLDLPTWVGNDARSATLAEASLGAGRGAEVAVMLTIGSGIGGGIAEGGELVLRAGTAGEFGHLPLFEAAGHCGCGADSCWELRASGSALNARLGGERISAYEDATADQLAVLHAWAGDLQRGLWAIQLTIDPDVFVVGGGAGRLAVEALHRYMAESVRKIGSLAPVVPAQFGEDAGLVGAAQLARNGLAQLTPSGQLE
jgi:glucokinase